MKTFFSILATFLFAAILLTQPEPRANASIFGTTDFLLEVAKGKVPKHVSVMRVAHADSVGTTKQTLWGESTIVSFPASATTMTLSSSDANDTSAGTGCRTAAVFGLDASHVESIETVSLAGLTGVTTVNSYLRVNIVRCMTTGSGEVNAGLIYIGTGTVTAGKPANVFNLIEIGHSISHSGFFTVPANKKAYLARLIFTVGATKYAEIFFSTRDTGANQPWVQQTSFDVIGATNPDPGFGFIIPSQADVRLDAIMDSGTGNVKVTGLIVIVENGG